MYYFRSFTFFCKLLFVFFGFPCMKQEYIEKNIAHPSNKPEEYAHYLQLSSRKLIILSIPVAAYTAYFIKNTIIVVVVLRMFDHYSPENDFKQVGDNLYEFTCVRTNCTSIRDENPLIDDLAKLPVFAICEEFWSSIYTPILHIDALGLLAFTLSAFGVFLIGTIIPWQQVLFPTSCDPAMFIVAPGITVRLMQEKVVSIIHEISHSYRNYVPLPKDWRAKGTSNSKYSALNTLDLAFSGKLFTFNQYSKPALQHVERVEEFARDCLPLVRSEWWRHWLAWLAFGFDIMSVSGLMSLCFSVLYYIQSAIIAKYDLMVDFMSLMKQKGCSIWNKDDQSNGVLGELVNTTIDLEAISYKYLRWHPYNFIETSFINLWPLCSLFLLCSYYACALFELNCWLAELHYHLLLAKDLCKLNLRRREKKRNLEMELTQTTVDSRMSEFDMGCLRQNFIHNSEIWFILLIKGHELTKMKHSANRERHKFLMHLVRDKNVSYESLAELFEKIYINIRLFTNYVNKLAPIMAILIVATYVINYVCVIIALWYIRNFKNFMTEPLVVGFVGWSVSNLLIFFGANFHASAKKIQPLIWSLIAQMTAYEDLQMEHLRTLWIKQAQILDYEGGIKLTALNIKITYVNIIQLIIWTATILLMAVNRTI